MSGPEREDAKTDFAMRLLAAMDEKNVTPTRSEREAGLPQGYMSKLLGTSRSTKAVTQPGPEVIRKLSDYLGVAYEWLAIGRGPMRPDGWAPSAVEAAAIFARRHGLPGEAIRAVRERYGDEYSMSVPEWIAAFVLEAGHLARAERGRELVAAARGATRAEARERRRGALADEPRRASPAKRRKS